MSRATSRSPRDAAVSTSNHASISSAVPVNVAVTVYRRSPRLISRPVMNSPAASSPSSPTQATFTNG